MAEIIVKEDIRGMFYENGKLYVTTSCIKSIIAYDFQTKTADLLGHYVEENSVFENIIKYDYKIYLFSPVGNDIIYYDMREKKYIDLLDLEFVKGDMDISGRKFFETLEYGGLIYAVCRRPNMVICINPQNDDVQIYHLSHGLLEDNDKIIEHFPVCIDDNKLIYVYSADIAVEFALDDRTFNIVYLEEQDSKNSSKEEYQYVVYGMVIGSSGERWMYNMYGKLLKVVGNKKIMVELPQEVTGAYDDGVSEQYKINRVLFINDKLYFVLQSDYKVLIYDTHTGEFTWHENTMAGWKENRRRLTYIVCEKIDAGSYLLYSYNDWSIYVWNAVNGFTDKIEIGLSCEEFVGNAAFDAYARNYFLHKDDLPVYLSFINQIDENENALEENRYGEKIFYGIE